MGSRRGEEINFLRKSWRLFFEVGALIAQGSACRVLQLAVAALSRLGKNELRSSGDASAGAGELFELIFRRTNFILESLSGESAEHLGFIQDVELEVPPLSLPSALTFR
jgi:hypothetical protein